MSEQQSDNQPRPVSAFTEGGHEVDVLPKGQLFGLILGLTLVIVASGLGIREFYNLQAGHHEQAASARPSARLQSLRDKDDQVLSSWGLVDEEQGLYRMPVDDAKERLLASPALLKAAPAPDDFVHPDEAAKAAGQ